MSKKQTAPIERKIYFKTGPVEAIETRMLVNGIILKDKNHPNYDQALQLQPQYEAAKACLIKHQKEWTDAH